MSLDKDYNSMSARVANMLGYTYNRDDGEHSMSAMIQEAMEKRGFANFSLKDNADDMYILKTAMIHGKKAVVKQPLKEYLSEFVKRPDAGPATENRDELIQRQMVGIGNAILSGALYYHEKDLNTVYAIGLSDEKNGGIAAYENKSGYVPREPKKPSVIKRILSVVGIFRDEVNQYKRDLAEYNESMADRGDQKMFEEFNKKEKADLSKQKADRRKAAEREIKGPEIKAAFDRQVGDLDRELASRKVGRSNFVQGKLYALAKSDPVRIDVAAKLKTAVEMKYNGLPLGADAYAGPSFVPSLKQFGIPLYGRDYARNSEKYPGSLRALAEIYPSSGTPTQEEVTDFFNTLENASVELNRGHTLSRENLSALKDILTKSTAVVRSGFERGGVTENTEVSAASPNIVGVMRFAAENTKRAELTGKLAGMLAEKYAPDSPEYASFREIQKDAAGLKEFCEACTELDGDVKEPFTMAQKMAKPAEYGTPYSRLQDAERSGEKDPETLHRLTADVVVSVMGEKSPWPNKEVRDEAAAQIAGNERFRKLVDNCPDRLSDAVKDKTFLQQISQAIAPEAQQQKEQQPQKQAELGRKGPSGPAPMGI